MNNQFGTFNVDGVTLDRKTAYQILVKEGIFWALNCQQYRFWGSYVTEKKTGRMVYETSNVCISEIKAKQKAEKFLFGLGLNVNNYEIIAKSQVFDLNDAIAIDRSKWTK